MVEVLLVIGLVVAAFVGFNIGGSSTGVAFGPAVGSDIVSKLTAAALMTGFAFLGAWTAGRNVIETMGGQIVPEDQFTLGASVAVLFFVGLALLISNTFGVPASTSMTAVGAIAGLGVATGTLDAAVMLEIISWWIVAPVIAFWICAVVGRYIYPYLDAKLKLDQSPGALLTVDRSGAIPRPAFGPNTTIREFGSIVLVVVIACYMAFSAGASNAANAVAPLVGNGAVGIDAAILLASATIGLGAFTIARRTLDTVGNDLTELPILAALIVETVSASLIAMLSWLGIPASLAVSATMCIVGLGWGRATRTVTIGQALGGKSPGMSVNALTTETDENVPRVGEESETDLAGRNLFDPGTTGRVIFFWLLTPSLSAAASYALFAVTSL
ncbi:inorganic phosphate transporter, PiT family [Halopelagius inordinatus]|uniref:Phosphate transporter n=1 Tax=Halopelagius inordinatus TaxID=553467 RepID=A0A1I2WEB7_9EURY|nr:inorganic phosphate transporter [Halopelagius inordinatus]SFG99673.1 inorganic phosphate transporter, PiT family [Halopelagius inordinatus]